MITITIMITIMIMSIMIMLTMKTIILIHYPVWARGPAEFISAAY